MSERCSDLAVVSVGDWTASERQHIAQLETLYKRDRDWELEYGRTDTGDPWCVVHNLPRDALVHIARIDRRYVVAWPQEQRSVSFASIKAAVDMALCEMEQFVSESSHSGVD
jgi:hypothetical protein